MRTSDNRVVVTGVGCLTSLGNNVEQYWEGLRQACSGISSITRFDTEKYRTKIGGEINVDVSELVGFNVSNLSRNTQFAMAAANETLADCGFADQDMDTKKTGICLGSGLGGIYFSEESIKSLQQCGPRGISPVTVPFVDPNSIVNQVAIRWGLTGQQFTISTACSSSAHAIGNALDMIRSGRVDAVLTGGVESTITPLVFAGFDRIRAMSIRNSSPDVACRPFSDDRDGFVMAEGAAMLMLERESDAVKRGANIYAEVAGYGATGGAFHVVKPKPEADDLVDAMQLALDDAGVLPTQIDLINPHGTGTRLNDEVEYKALKLLFNDCLNDIAITPIKQLTGHTLGASGAVEAVHVVKSIKSSCVTPIQYCDNPYRLKINTTNSISRKIVYALNNSFGFGNNNVCLVFGAQV